MVKEQFQRFGISLIADIKDGIVSSGASATGKSAASLNDESSEDGYTLYGSKSFKFIETGRGPGKFPPLNNIYEWLIAKGIPTKNPKGLAFGIARKIANQGTKLYRESKTRDVITSAIDNHVKSLFEEITTSAKADISNDLARYFSNN